MGTWRTRAVIAGVSLLTLVPALAAHAAAGSLDRSFGNGSGKVQIPQIAMGPDSRRAMAIQPDGNIVVAAARYSSGSSSLFGVARLRPNGDPDASFGGDGVVLTKFGHPGCAVDNALVFQADGKIVAAGSSGCGRHSRFALARYLPNGHLDTTFSGDGKVTTAFHAGDCDRAFGVAVQADGSIVAVGQAACGIDNWKVAVARYLPNGHLDSTFSGDGKLMTDLSRSPDIANAVVVQPDGAILVVGTAGMIESNNAQLALVRYLPNGQRDATFSGDGIVRTKFGGDQPCGPAEGFGLALQGDGKIVAAGDTGCGLLRLAVARYLPNGHLDTTFGGDGKVATGPSTNAGADCVGQAAGRDVAAQPDGKIVVVGSAGCTAQITWALYRYETNGSLDSTFGHGGRLNSSVFGCPDCFAEAESVAVQNDGKIVAAGFSSGADGTALARYKPA
jgi:uncharacterized delta-60 repeat protein